MGADNWLRILLSGIGLIPTTIFLTQTLKTRWSVRRTLLVHILFDMVSVFVKEWGNMQSGQFTMGMSSVMLMALYLMGLLICFRDSLKRTIVMLMIPIGCTTVTEISWTAVLVKNGWVSENSFFEIHNYIKAMVCEIIFLSLILSGIIFWIRRRNADFRGKSVGIVALTSGSILFAMYPYLRYIVEGKNKISFGQYLIFLLHPAVSSSACRGKGDRTASGK